MPQLKRAYTIGMVRLLRRIGPVKRRGRIPRQQQPDVLRLEYYKALMPFVHAMTGAFDEAKGDIIHALMTERRAQGKMDGPPPGGDHPKRLVDKAQRTAEEDLKRGRVEETARRFGRRVSSFQREQLDKQVRGALGVSLSFIEPATVYKLEGFAAENAALINSVSERYFDRIRSDVQEAFETGMHPNTLAESFQDRYDMAESDARRIARDQIGKLMGDFNQARQVELGVTSYIWRTVNDKRVRVDHQDREGRRYSWSNPPPDGHPGSPIQCRCYAEPDLSPIMGDLTE